LNLTKHAAAQAAGAKPHTLACWSAYKNSEMKGPPSAHVLAGPASVGGGASFSANRAKEDFLTAHHIFATRASRAATLRFFGQKPVNKRQRIGN